MSHTQMALSIGLEKSLYDKRRRDDSAFLAKEFLHACSRLGISLDAALGLHAAATAPTAFGSSTGTAGYLTSVGDLTDAIRDSAALAAAPVDIEASSTDIPMLHFLGDPVLRAVKLYLFRSIEPAFAWPDLDAELRELSEVPVADAGLGGAGVPVGSHVEIWGTDPLASLFRQLAYVAAKGALKEWTIELVRERLLALTERLEARPRAGQADKPAATDESEVVPLTLYLEDLRGCSAQYVFAVRERTWSVFTYDLPDYLVFPTEQMAVLFRRAFAKRLYLGECVADRGGLPISTFVRRLRDTIDERCAGLPSA